MLTLYTPDGAIPLRVSDYYIKELASGLNELCFTISIWDDAFQLIQEESSIREESDGITACNYLVKAIDSGKNTANIKAQQTVIQQLDAIHRSLTHRKDFPTGNGWQIYAIETVSSPRFLGRENNNRFQWLYGSSLRVKINTKGINGL